MKRSTLIAILALSACGKNMRSQTTPPPIEVDPTGSGPTEEEQVQSVQTWSIWEGNRRVLTVVDRPGLLISTAPPPPGPSKPATHPFLSASAESPMHEHQLRVLLRASDSTDEFLKALRAAGFEVKQEEPSTAR